MKALLLTTLLSATAFAAAEPKVVMVLYFDNNSNQREYDVLQKGLADMLISDLAQVEGIRVVEREKLQAVLDELKLQKTKYFDPKTAVKIGKGVGAQYAVTGSIMEFSPQMRLNVRLINLSTDVIEKDESVVGEKEKFFELEQQLANKFIAKLGSKAPAEARSGEVSLDGAVSYSKALDLADKGDLKAASEQLSKAVEDAPDFTLGKERYAALLKRLREAGKKREQVISADEKKLLENIEASLKRGLTAPLKPYELQGYWCHRGLNADYLLWKMSALPAKAEGDAAQIVTKDVRAETLALMKKYFENAEQSLTEVTGMMQTMQNANFSVECPMTLYQLKSDSFQLLKFNLRAPFYGFVKTHPVDVIESLTVFTFAGRHNVPGGPGEPDEGTTYRFIRPLYALDPSYGPKMLALIDKAEKALDTKDNTYPGAEARETSIATSRAIAYASMRQPQKAIAVLQALLEKYPKSKRYKTYEKLVEGLLGASEEAVAAQKAIKSCNLTALDATVEEEVSRVADASGARGLQQTLAALQKCEGPKSAAVFKKAQTQAAKEAALVGDCTLEKAIEAMGPTQYGPACD